MSILNADSGSMASSGYHKINLVIMGLTPVCFALSPSPIAMPLDIALGVALPLHAHIGMNYVITDYVPKLSKGAVGPARLVMLALTTTTVLGLLKVNVMGEGMTETVKKLWRGEEKK
jgi:succinate dehydrogenase (ubiquinone) membrane anchor subunit